MQETEIYKAASEILAENAQSSRPASELINTYTRMRRYIGAKDRRFLTEIVWGVLRAQARLNYLLPHATWSKKIELFLRGYPEDTSFPQWVEWETPEWLLPFIADPALELPALLPPAPSILRANGSREKIMQSLLQEGIVTAPTKLSPHGLILSQRCNLAQTKCFRTGKIEVQDEGSQLVALETGILPGESILDFCAGAGGKSLIFAQMMKNQGEIIAHDISERSLLELEKRAKRAGVNIIHTTLALPERTFQHVVVDAPCSGTGTWRRNPDARWKINQDQLETVVQKQTSILEQSKELVAPGGKLSYITCSITTVENGIQVARFLAENKNFTLIRQKQFSPARTETDGLYIAILQKTAG